MFTEAVLDELSSLIADRTGLNTFGHARHRLVELLYQHAEAVHNPPEYVERLRRLPEQHPIWQALLAELTVGETYFMRDSVQIKALREVILPALVQSKRRLRLWSAGCATGEEAYTLAMLIDELVPDASQRDIQIMGTDINAAALEIARAGRYREWSFRGTPKAVIERYFTQHAPHVYEIAPRLRGMVRFHHRNLIYDAPEPQDLIICRNVLLYFTRPQTELVETQLLHSLDANGWLLLSPIETLRSSRTAYQHLRFEGTPLYQKLPHAPIIKVTSETSPTLAEPMPTVVSINPTYRQAVQALQRGQLTDALALSQAQLTQQATPSLYTLVAASLMGLGDWENAYEHLQHALNLDSLHPESHYLLALLYMEEGDWLNARIALRAAIYCRPDFALAHLVSGDLFMLEQESERAARAWSSARRFANELSADTPLSDIADVTAGQLMMLVDNRLARLSS